MDSVVLSVGLFQSTYVRASSNRSRFFLSQFELVFVNQTLELWIYFFLPLWNNHRFDLNFEIDRRYLNFQVASSSINNFFASAASYSTINGFI